MGVRVMDAKTSGRLQMNERIKGLWERAKVIDRERRRQSFAISSDIGLGQASSRPGRPWGASEKDVVLVGDQDCKVRVEYPFPGKLPSSEKGFSYNQINWAEDYAAFLDQSPAEIYPYELIVGEYHWSFAYNNEGRGRTFPDQQELEVLAEKAARFGGGGFPVTHTCADLSIGLVQGWGGILGKIRKSHEKFSGKGARKEADYLQAAEMVCFAIMRFIQKYSEKALSLAGKETDKTRKEIYLKIAKVCENISQNPPTSFHEAVQWIWFYIMVERMGLAGNGYGRLDRLLHPFYQKDVEEGRITREAARELIAELFLKYPTYYSLGGRDKNGKDATNEVSWLVLEAYDMVGGTSGFGVLWHSDIGKEFFRYACDILVRHGTGSPALVNQDVLRESEIRYGVKEEDAWNVAYSGCFWYCIPGKEWCTHDTQTVSGIKCLMNALDVAFQRKISGFEETLEVILY